MFSSIRNSCWASLCGLLLSFAQGYSYPSQHVWWNDPGCGDIMEMMVYVSSTAPTTYYETLGWNQGTNGGGYTGIQTLSDMTPQYIFSLWNPTTTTDPIAVVYVHPDGIAQPFGGEGEGMQYLNRKTGWKLNRWYRQVVRAWPYKGHTYYGMWTYDVSKRQWMHHVTFDFPVPNMSFCKSAVSFMENWTGGNPSALRHASFTGGWKRFNNTFVAFNSAYVDGDLTKYGEEVLSNHECIFMQTGQATSNHSNTLNISFNIPPYTEDSTNPYVKTQNIQINGDILIYSWTVDTSQNPPFAYKVMLVDKTTHAILATKHDIRPRARSVQFNLKPFSVPHANLAIQTVITDLYDIAHTAQANM